MREAGNGERGTGSGLASRATAWVLALIVIFLFVFVGPTGWVDASEKLSRRERKERIAALDEKYLTFLDEVDPIISPAEIDAFLKMESDPQRDLFIEDFWRRRDPDPTTAINEYRDSYYARREIATERYRSINTDRGRIFLLRGEPAAIHEVDTCRYLRPLEIWIYVDQGRTEPLVFFRPGASYILWDGKRHTSMPSLDPNLSRSYARNSFTALEELLNPSGLSEGVERVFFDHLERRGNQNIMVPALVVQRCANGEVILDAIHTTQARGQDVHRAFQPPTIGEEDVRRMLRTSVVSDPDAPPIELESSSVDFTGSKGSRTLVRLFTEVRTSSMQPITTGGREFYQINAVGETLHDGKMFERWEYRFDFPREQASAVLPVAIERALRKGRWELRMKLVDPESGAEAIVTEVVDVPAADAIEVAGDEDGPEDRMLEESRSVIRLLPPEGSVLTGFKKFEVTAAGDGVAGVEFYLDGTRIMRKMRPPFSLELDLGPVPRPHTVRAVALDRRRRPIDEDILKLNDGTDPFRVRIVSPRLGKDVTGPVRVEMEPKVPSDAKLASLELYRNDDRVVTLYEEPWIHTVFLPDEPELTVFRVVATLEDESIRPVEDVVILNGPENLERVDVRLIEVPTTVFADGHPLQHLSRDAFELLDSGKKVEVAKFERLSNQPLSIGIAIDGSASMKERLTGARNAASSFLEKVLTPRDRAFLVSFDRRVFTLADWTSDPEALNEGLASLRAEESTAMYDAVIESLYRFVGLEGQRALILISDGADTASRFGWEPTLEYARRLGVPIYTIGIGISVANLEARMRLQALSDSTGARSWFVSDVDELAGPYEQIERELRSQYLLGFYMPEEIEQGSEWRELVVRVEGADEVRALPGYYP